MHCKLVEICPDHSFIPWVLVPSNSPLPRFLVIHNGLRISQLLELRLREEVEWVVDY
jgi:hypothetical protein